MEERKWNMCPFMFAASTVGTSLAAMITGEKASNDDVNSIVAASRCVGGSCEWWSETTKHCYVKHGKD